jgi:hypothetical protein
MSVPDSSRVEFRHLRAFEAVARLKSFAQAAGELMITQPALTRTIQQLEDALGATLLDRSSRHRRDPRRGCQAQYSSWGAIHCAARRPAKPGRAGVSAPGA